MGGRLKVKSVPFAPSASSASPESKRLPRREFARALRRGLGRARIDARRHGLAGREDLLVAACLRNATLDPQLEGSLASWLLAVARDGRALPAARRAVFAAATQPIARAKDAKQIADLVAHLAANGDARAARVLLRMVDVQAPDDSAGASQAIWALGEPGWLRVAQSYGKRWETARAADLSYLAYRAVERLGARRALASLQGLAARDRRVRPLLAAVQSDLAPSRRTEDEVPAPAGLDELERRIDLADGSASALWRWTRAANSAGRAEAWRRIFRERDVRRLRRRLGAFFLNGAPRTLDARLFRLASHPDTRVRRQAMRLLARYRNPRIRALAVRRLVAEPRRAVEQGLLHLLARNACADDAPRVASLLVSCRSEEAAHDWARGVEEIAERRRGPRWDALLLRAYDVTPCRACREFLLRKLVDRGVAPRAMLREAIWDANRHVRRIAREALRRG